MKASVGEEEKLQIFAPTQKVDEEINIGGNLGTEIGFGASRYVAVADTNVTSKRGSQQALAVLNGAIEAVNGQLTDLCVLENHMSPVINCRGNTDGGASLGGCVVDPAAARDAAELTKQQMLAQARQLPPLVLSLVRKWVHER